MSVYSFVKTYDLDGVEVDSRVIDLASDYARKWLLNHHWWALTNAKAVALYEAQKEDFDEYNLRRLADKFNETVSVH